jgi:hypothetical protein
MAHVAPVPVEVTATTARRGRLLRAAALLEQRPMVEATCCAAAASLLAVAGYGSQPAHPARADLEELARQLEIADVSAVSAWLPDHSWRIESWPGPESSRFDVDTQRQRIAPPVQENRIVVAPIG